MKAGRSETQNETTSDMMMCTRCQHPIPECQCSYCEVCGVQGCTEHVSGTRYFHTREIKWAGEGVYILATRTWQRASSIRTVEVAMKACHLVEYVTIEDTWIEG